MCEHLVGVVRLDLPVATGVLSPSAKRNTLFHLNRLTKWE